MKEEFHFFEPTFKDAVRDKYNCNVQVYDQCILICFIEGKSIVSIKRIKCFNDASSILETLTLEKSLGGKHKTLTFSISNDQYCYVPKELFEVEQLQKSMELNCGKNDELSYFSKYSERQNIEILYGINTVLYNGIKTSFPSANINHHSNTLTDTIASDFDTNNKDKIYVHAQDKSLSVVCFSKQKLIYHSTFVIATPEDYLYYLLFTCKQIGLDPKETKVILLGDLKSGGKQHHYTYNYFNKIQFGNVKSDFTTGDVVREIPKYQLLTLFKEHLCV